jgi:hypothetical protein
MLDESCYSHETGAKLWIIVKIRFENVHGSKNSGGKTAQRLNLFENASFGSMQTTIAVWDGFMIAPVQTGHRRQSPIAPLHCCWRWPVILDLIRLEVKCVMQFLSLPLCVSLAVPGLGAGSGQVINSPGLLLSPVAGRSFFACTAAYPLALPWVAATVGHFRPAELARYNAEMCNTKRHGWSGT